MPILRVNLDADVLSDAKNYAQDRELPLDSAISELVRRGLSAPAATQILNGVHVFNLPKDSPRVTTSRVREIETGS